MAARSLVTLMACGALALAGCGGGDSAGKDGKPCKDDGSCNPGLHCMQTGVCQAEVTLAEFATESAAVYCGWLFSCCSDAEIDEFESRLGADSLADEATCIATFETSLQNSYSTPATAAIDAGRGEYFADKAASCLAEGSRLTCSGNGQQLLQELLALCDESYNGLQQVDDACAHQVECRFGLQCHEGTCKGLLAADEACSTAAGARLCAEGLYCNPNSQVCEQRKAPGEACEDLSDLECQTGYECSGEPLTCTEIDTEFCTGR